MKFNLPVTKKSQDGQVLLIILLVVSVLLVVGLSAVSRSVTDIKTSRQSQEAARALWVAQAGLEEAIKTGSGIESLDTSGITYKVDRTQIGEGSYFQFPNPISANESVTIWLVNHNETTGAIEIPPIQVSQLRIGWSAFGDTENPALEATLIYKSGVNFFTRRYVYDPNNSHSTNFAGDAGSCTFGETDFAGGTVFAHCSGIIAFPAGIPYLMRIKLLFNSSPQPVGVEVTAASLSQSFPIQGQCYDSTAKVNESGVTRRLRECRFWPVTPSIFDNLLWSGSDI